MYYPVKPVGVNQIFGNPDPKYFQFGLKGHNGIDFRAFHGQRVFASHDGIAYVQVDSSEGHGVVVLSEQTFDYGEIQAYYATIYWHLMADIPLVEGQRVKAGDLIGYADSTGFSTGDHLHFGLKPKVIGENPPNGDPTDSLGNFVNIEQKKGFLGAIDPSPYFNGLYAEDVNIIRSAYYALNANGLLKHLGDVIKRLLIG